MLAGVHGQSIATEDSTDSVKHHHAFLVKWNIVWEQVPRGLHASIQHSSASIVGVTRRPTRTHRGTPAQDNAHSKAVCKHGDALDIEQHAGAAGPEPEPAT
eukprot:372410-Lingulodinium_polyedra.AAC.1